jgi:hypothetical protein
MNGGTSNMSRLLADYAVLNQGTDDELVKYIYNNYFLSSSFN